MMKGNRALQQSRNIGYMCKGSKEIECGTFCMVSFIFRSEISERILPYCKGSLIMAQRMWLPRKGGKALPLGVSKVQQIKHQQQIKSVLKNKLLFRRMVEIIWQVFSFSISVLLQLQSNPFQLPYCSSCIEAPWIHKTDKIQLHFLDSLMLLRTQCLIYWSCVKEKLQNTNAWHKSFLFINVLQACTQIQAINSSWSIFIFHYNQQSVDDKLQ